MTNNNKLFVGNCAVMKKCTSLVYQTIFMIEILWMYIDFWGEKRLNID